KDFRNYVDYLVNDTGNISFYSTYQNILAIYTNTINSHLTTLLQNKTDIKNFKESFPTSDLDIRSYEILVRQKEDLLKDAKSRISDYYIRAPFDGIITDISVSPGEFASVGSPIVSMISKDKNEVSVDITEDDIAFVDVGDEASITFDAFDDLLVKAKVTYISPNTKTKDGVAVFEVILQITENVKQIKVGLSADVDIFTEKLTNVIVIPRRSIIEEDGNRFVRLLIDDSTYKKQIISTGLQGEDGLVEVKDGLVVGDTIITFIDKKELVNLTEIK
ncbi:MAG: efflux RND transporter periplasmic adaptor subunit, partial [Candidatus Paceibacterota bacterium]